LKNEHKFIRSSDPNFILVPNLQVTILYKFFFQLSERMYSISQHVARLSEKVRPFHSFPSSDNYIANVLAFIK
jgi:hypothetical protein